MPIGYFREFDGKSKWESYVILGMICLHKKSLQKDSLYWLFFHHLYFGFSLSFIFIKATLALNTLHVTFKSVKTLSLVLKNTRSVLSVDYINRGFPIAIYLKDRKQILSCYHGWFILLTTDDNRNCLQMWIGRYFMLLLLRIV